MMPNGVAIKPNNWLIKLVLFIPGFELVEIRGQDVAIDYGVTACWSSDRHRSTQILVA
jgi:hypothetical protein